MAECNLNSDEFKNPALKGFAEAKCKQAHAKY
jgi:hypothetical protein